MEDWRTNYKAMDAKQLHRAFARVSDPERAYKDREARLDCIRQELALKEGR